jgi:ABC-type sugar transport system substrate-binding protein
MKTKKLLSLAMAGVLAVALLAGCGSSSSSSSASGSSSASESGSSSASSSASVSSGSGSVASTSSETVTPNGDYKIGIILKTLSAEYWGYVKAGCDAAAADMGISVEVMGPPSETSYDEQMNMITTAVDSNKYNALIISPLQSDMVATQIASATIPVLAVDTNIESDKISCFVGTGNEEAAKQGGEAAVEAAKKAGWKEIKAICISGVQGDSTAEARLKGFEEGVNAAGGEFLSNEVQYADAVADKAVNSMEAVMQNHPEGVAIICTHNDDLAVAAARTMAGNEAFKNTIVCGFNGDKSACQSILDGQETMSVAQNPYQMGYLAVQNAVKVLNGETVEKFVDSGSKMITADNAQEQIDTLDSYLNG